jgi:hypothetical protein
MQDISANNFSPVCDLLTGIASLRTSRRMIKFAKDFAAARASGSGPEIKLGISPCRTFEVINGVRIQDRIKLPKRYR